MVAIKT